MRMYCSTHFERQSPNFTLRIISKLTKWDGMGWQVRLTELMYLVLFLEALSELIRKSVAALSICKNNSGEFVLLPFLYQLLFFNPFPHWKILMNLHMFLFQMDQFHWKIDLSEFAATLKQESDVFGQVTFTKPVSINNLISSDINEINPHFMLINGTDQTFPFSPTFDTLIVTNNFQV